MLKKINAGLGLFTVVVLLAHIGVGFQSLKGVTLPVTEVMPILTMVLVILHALLSMMILMFVHEGNSAAYPKLNLSTIVQRASGILLVVPLVISHTKVYSDPGTYTLLHGISEIAFFILAFAHIGVSVPKALVTLGALKKEKTVKIVSIISAVAALGLTVDGVALAVRTLF